LPTSSSSRDFFNPLQPAGEIILARNINYALNVNGLPLPAADTGRWHCHMSALGKRPGSIQVILKLNAAANSLS
jgi:hypothetical protein